jgi:hypothetical protein
MDVLMAYRLRERGIESVSEQKKMGKLACQAAGFAAGAGII